MESDKAILFTGENMVKVLTLVGYNDDFDEIIANSDGTMTVKTMETVKNDDGEWIDKEFVYENITRINFK